MGDGCHDCKWSWDCYPRRERWVGNVPSLCSDDEDRKYFAFGLHGLSCRILLLWIVKMKRLLLDVYDTIWTYIILE